MSGKRGAAELLGMNSSTLASRMRALGISDNDRSGRSDGYLVSDESGSLVDTFEEAFKVHINRCRGGQPASRKTSTH